MPEGSQALLGAVVPEESRQWGEIVEGFQIEDAEAFLSEDGTRRHFETRPCGGSKTTDLAGISLVWLALDAVPGARGYVFAGSRDQAALLLERPAVSSVAQQS